MAMSEERARHLELAGVVKSVHAHLRKEYKRRKEDFNDVWKEHTERTDILQEYAAAMQDLATQHWEKNDGTRIDWCRDFCLEYFYGGLLKHVLEREVRRSRTRNQGPVKCDTTDKVTGSAVQPLEESDDGGSNRNVADVETSSDMSAVERDDLPDGCASQREGCPDGSVNERDGCPDGSVNERPVPDGSVNYRDGLSQTASNTARVRSSRTKIELPFDGPIYLLDVGSCYNPFQHFDGFCVTALDLHPATESVLQCDFLECEVTDKLADVRETHSSQTRTDDLNERGSFPGNNLPILNVCESRAVGDQSDSGDFRTHRVSCRGDRNDEAGCRGDGEKMGNHGDGFNRRNHGDGFNPRNSRVSHQGEGYRNDAIGCHSDNHTVCDVYPRMLTSPVTQLLRMSFDVVVFSLLLEYLPCCKQRFLCCQKAWEILRLNGLLLIVTPDSHRQHRNAAMIKSWKQGIESIGFQRIRYLKQEHIHCMAFRRLESRTHDAGDLSEMLYIPQDFHEDEEEEEKEPIYYDPDDIVADFDELPNFLPC